MRLPTASVCQFVQDNEPERCVIPFPKFIRCLYSVSLYGYRETQIYTYKYIGAVCAAHCKIQFSQLVLNFQLNTSESVVFFKTICVRGRIAENILCAYVHSVRTLGEFRKLEYLMSTQPHPRRPYTWTMHKHITKVNCCMANGAIVFEL